MDSLQCDIHVHESKVQQDCSLVGDYINSAFAFVPDSKVYMVEMHLMEKYLRAIGLEEGEIIDTNDWGVLWKSFPLAMRYLGSLDDLRFPRSMFLRDGGDIGHSKPSRAVHKVNVKATRSGHGLVVQDMKHDRLDRSLQRASWRQQRNVQLTIAIDGSGGCF
jgi:hypothetical protein